MEVVKILSVAQEEENGVKELLKEDIWGSIKEFLGWGFHWTEDGKSVHITVGLLLLLIVAFIVTSFVLKSLRQILTRKMETEDKLKFVSIFKFIRYLVYIIVTLLTVSAAGIDITLLITASAALFVGLGLALQEIFQDIIGGIFIIIPRTISKRSPQASVASTIWSMTSCLASSVR